MLGQLTCIQLIWHAYVAGKPRRSLHELLARVTIDAMRAAAAVYWWVILWGTVGIQEGQNPLFWPKVAHLLRHLTGK